MSLFGKFKLEDMLERAMKHIDSARELARDGGEILKLDIMQLVPIAKKMGFVEKVV